MFRKLKALYKLYWKLSPWFLEYLATQPTSGVFFQRNDGSGRSLDVLVSGTDDQLRNRLKKILGVIGKEDLYLFK